MGTQISSATAEEFSMASTRKLPAEKKTAPPSPVEKQDADIRAMTDINSVTKVESTSAASGRQGNTKVTA